MALIDCPSCDRHVSDHAFSCPHCSYRFPPAWIAPQRVISTIDDPSLIAAAQTRTRYRGMLFIGLLAIVLGMTAIVESRGAETEPDHFGPVLLVLGVLVLVGTGIVAVWRPRSR